MSHCRSNKLRSYITVTKLYSICNCIGINKHYQRISSTYDDLTREVRTQTLQRMIGNRYTEPVLPATIAMSSMYLYAVCIVCGKRHNTVKCPFVCSGFLLRSGAGSRYRLIATAVARHASCEPRRFWSDCK